MNVALAGASGFIGSLLTDRLHQAGHQVVRMVRSRERAGAGDAIFWSPAEGEIDAQGLARADAVVNLAGESPFAIWTPARKRRIYQSRVDGTRLVATALARLPAERRPGTLINASAVGYFGSQPPDEPLAEDGAPGTGFMASVTQDWESATGPARDAGIRVVNLRFAPVLGPEAFIVRATRLATLLGLGATLGSGRQAFPWVTRDDAVGVAVFALQRPDLRGPVNVAAPEKVTHREFADTAARVLNRPRFLAIPRPIVRLAGEFGKEILTGAWVVPQKLAEAGYAWRDPTLEPAFRRML
jgi:uncharacterized protein